MTEDAIPTWAIREALRRSQLREDAYQTCPPFSQRLMEQLAIMIAKHEQQPVDRATEITREAVAIWHETLHLSGEAEPDNELASLARRGELDDRKDFIRVRQYLASLLAEQSNG